MTKKPDQPIFYVYALLNPLKKGDFTYFLENGETLHFDFEPFYVGKGHGNRVYDHFNERKTIQNSHKNNTIKKIRLSGISNEDFKRKTTKRHYG